MKKNGIPVPPSEILNEGILKPVGMTANALATAIRVPANRITEFQRDERAHCSRVVAVRCSMDSTSEDSTVQLLRTQVKGVESYQGKRFAVHSPGWGLPSRY